MPALAGAEHARTELKLVRVASGLSAPVYVTAPRSEPGRLYIVEQFGRIKGVGGLRQTKFRGLAKVDWAFTFVAAAYHLVRLPKLIGTTT